MLQIQSYLLSGKTLDDLNAELGIKSALHPELPLVILNYDQIESPKTHSIVREARGLVLNPQDWSLVARSFPRFFNWGEVQEEMHLFDFTDFLVQSKEDGSLVLLYHFNGKWHANTRGSFGLDNMQNQSFSWRAGICKALNISDLSELDSKLDPKLTYVCEFVSPWNKVVRHYQEPRMYLLTVFCGEQEVHHADVDVMFASNYARPVTYSPFLRPQKFAFANVDDIQSFLQEQAADDPTFEGVVMCDAKGQRWKIKSATYLGLHKLRGEGDNLYNPKHLLPFVLTGEDDELLTYYPEVADAYKELKGKVESEYASMLAVWQQFKDVESQKDFALAVKDTNFSSVLFQVRKKFGSGQTEKDLRKEFLGSDQLILKKVCR
jgi:hypothetical protein